MSTGYNITQSILFGENIYVQSSFNRSLLIGSLIYNSGSQNLIVGYNCTGNSSFNTLLGEGLYTTSSKHYGYGAFLFGKFNTTNKFRTSESSVCIFDVAGGGTSSARKSLFEIYRNGNTYLNGIFETKGLSFTNEENTMTNTPKPIKYTTNYTGTLETGDDDTNIITTKAYVDDEIQSHSGGGGGYPDDIVCKTINASKEFGDGEVYGDIIKSKTFTDGDITNQAKLVNASLTLGRASYSQPFNDVSYSNIVCGGGGNTLTSTSKITESIFFGDIVYYRIVIEYLIWVITIH